MVQKLAVDNNALDEQPFGEPTFIPQKISIVDELEHWLDPEHIAAAVRGLEELTPEYLNLLYLNSGDEVAQRLDEASIKAFNLLRRYKHKAYPIKEEMYLGMIGTLAYYLRDSNPNIAPDNYEKLFSLGVILISPAEIRDLYLRAFFQHEKEDFARRMNFDWMIEESIRVLLQLAKKIEEAFEMVQKSRNKEG